MPLSIAGKRIDAVSPLRRALIEKVGHDNGFEHVAGLTADALTLASARHRTEAYVRAMETTIYRVAFAKASQSLIVELARSIGDAVCPDGSFEVVGESGLARCLHRAADLARALPNQAEADFQQAVSAELKALPAAALSTEIERVVRQRVGQSRFRDAMLDYWGGACAVTGIALPVVLRASHAKPWADCATDAERLNVFNGFLLNANLDALFDRFLISFDKEGCLLHSTVLTKDLLASLGLSSNMRTRWIAEGHKPFMDYHRDRFHLLLSAHGHPSKT